MDERSSSAVVRGMLVSLSALAVAALLMLLWISAAPGAAEVKEAGKEKALVITIVFDNNPFDKELQTGWGFACVVEGLDETLLFDTGADGGVLLSNMTKCGFKPEQIDTIVLSHIHGDHTDGLAAFLAANGKVKVVLPKAFPGRFKENVRKSGATVVETEGPHKVCEGAWTTGVLGGPVKEQGLYLTTPQGLVVVTGCAHPGIVSIAAAAKEHADTPVFAVLGGFHMGGASSAQIARVIEGLRKLGVSRVAPTHCSGDQTRLEMKKAFGEGYLPSGVGARLAFEAGPEKKK